jgi:hypothetical protein
VASCPSWSAQAPMTSRRRDRYVRKPSQPVRAHREHPPSRPPAKLPAQPRRPPGMPGYAAARDQAPRCAPHLLRAATRGRRLRRGSKLVGRPHHGCCSTARRPYPRCPARWRAAPERCHDCRHASPQRLAHIGFRTERGRDREPQLDSFGHDACATDVGGAHPVRSSMQRNGRRARIRQRPFWRSRRRISASTSGEREPRYASGSSRSTSTGKASAW